jgi:broad specificity phosphatase PhoE
MATTGADSALDAGSAPSGVPRGIVVLVRHGETQWSTSGRHTGRTDVPLTEEGERQGKVLSTVLEPVLAGRRVVLSLTSPLARARRTAQLAGLAATEEPALAEVDYGEYEGLTTTAIRTWASGWTIWTGGLPGGETLDAVAARVDALIGRVRAALEASAAEDPPPAVVLVGHGHLLRVFAARWIGLPPSAGAMFALATASVSVLGREHETPVLVHWNMPVDNGPP